MNIKQALKKKNKLVGDIKKEFQKIAAHNRIMEGNTRPYSITESLEKWISLTNQLVELKTSIQIANQPVLNKIFLLAELKSQVKSLSMLDCSSGIERSHYSEPYKWESEIDTGKKDALIAELENKIESIQEELDQFNHNTLIK
jgi:hypothetical protein